MEIKGFTYGYSAKKGMYNCNWQFIRFQSFTGHGITIFISSVSRASAFTTCPDTPVSYKPNTIFSVPPLNLLLAKGTQMQERMFSIAVPPKTYLLINSGSASSHVVSCFAKSSQLVDMDFSRFCKSARLSA